MDFGTQIEAADHEPVEGRERDLAQEHRVHVEVYVIRIFRDEYDADAEEEREYEPYRGVLFHELGPVEELDEADREHAAERRADDKYGGGNIAHGEEREHYPEKYRVAYSVAHHGHSSEHEKNARDRASDGHEGSDNLDLDLLSAHPVPRPSLPEPSPPPQFPPS